jgi:hypothetical protein
VAAAVERYTINDYGISKRLFSRPDCRMMLNKVPRLTGS